MKVYLISRPAVSWDAVGQFLKDEGRTWIQTGGVAESLCEIAGRLCYMSYGKGRKTNDEFIRHIIESGHHSVLEHSNFTVLITGISRSCSHELVRHRHLSFSQLSQRYVDESEAAMVMPEVLKTVGTADTFERVVHTARTAYGIIVANLERLYHDMPDRTMRHKLARQVARSVLPNATETKIVVTGNVRAWRHFISLRASAHADTEIRDLAIAIFHELHQIAPALFQDLKGAVEACVSI